MTITLLFVLAGQAGPQRVMRAVSFSTEHHSLYFSVTCHAVPTLMPKGGSVRRRRSLVSDLVLQLMNGQHGMPPVSYTAGG